VMRRLRARFKKERRAADTAHSPTPSKQAQIKLASPAHDQIGEDFSNRAGELEPVPRTRAGQEDLGDARVAVDEEMFIRRVRVETNRAGHQPSVGRGQEAAEDLARGLDFLGRDLALDRVRRGDITGMMTRDLDPLAEIGKAVEKPTAVELPEVNGAVLRGE